MRLEWDEAKRLANLERHGLDFADTEEVLEGDTFEVEDDRVDYGEPRFATLGWLGGLVVLVVWTPREDATRIASMRRATRYEQQEFFKQLGH